MDLKVRKHIYFYGRVQGVGFRYYAVQKAGQLGLAGWVRNRYDGSVEMEVEGAETDIDQMILFLQNRTYIWIEDMRVKSMSLEGEYDFMRGKMNKKRRISYCSLVISREFFCEQRSQKTRDISREFMRSA